MKRIITTDEVPFSSRQRKPRMALVSALVALTLVIGAIMLVCLERPSADRPRGTPVTVRWYFERGQLGADLRTLLASARYLLEPDPDPSNRSAVAVSRLPDGGVPNPKALTVDSNPAPRVFPLSLTPAKPAPGSPL